MLDQNLDDQLIHDYLAESREHLATIESDLLAIEQAGANIDEELVNRVFRAAHSIKGGAGFFGLTVIRELAHKTENVLDLIRSRQIAPNPELVSILLLAFDKLRELVADHSASNQADIEEFVAALTAAATSQLPESRRALLTSVVTLRVENASRWIQIPAFDLDQARRGGKWIYLIRYDLFHDFERQGMTPLAALRALMKYGVIVETSFDFDSAGSLDQESSHQLTLEVLYATVLDRELIGELVKVDPAKVLVIEKNGSVQPLGGSDQLPARLTPLENAAAPATTMELAPPGAGSATIEPPAANAPAANPAAGSALSGSALTGSALSGSPVSNPPVEATIRLNVALLDSLMTLAGELVLNRNELNEAVSKQDQPGIETAAHRLSVVTSELQEAVALTRMQPVGTVFAKFPRLVRELARTLGKDVQVQVEGGEVELDKTIIEGLSDPLTHMVRNAVDHGLEPPDQRIARGKTPTGTVKLRARHQAGQVVIEIADDGRGIVPEKIAASCIRKGLITPEQAQNMTDSDKMALIFLPGSSTAEKISDVSGRGVGMDVVKTNLDKLGGKIEIDSAPGKGSSFRIKLPLTLAIMPSLLVSEDGERFAIPQSSVAELIRISAAQRAQRIDRVGDAEVLVLRDRLVPLLHLASAMGIADRERATRTWNIVLVDTGTFEYGLVVQDLHDTVEIVVKPLGRHLQGLRDYAGATILGDGRVASILDVEGLAARAGLAQISASLTAGREAAVADSGDVSSLLLFHNAPQEPCALPIGLVTRIENVVPAQIERLGGRRTFQYRGASLPLVALQDIAAVGALEETQDWKVIVVERNVERNAGRNIERSTGRHEGPGNPPNRRRGGGSFGLLVAGPLDMLETTLAVDPVTLRQKGVAGSAILNGKATLILEIVDLAESALGSRFSEPSWIGPGEPGELGPAEPTNGEPRTGEAKTGEPKMLETQPPTILIAEDSDFFRGQIKRLIEAVGYRVVAAEDGQSAWEMLNRHAGKVSAVVTDLEMPRLGGLGLTRRIREDSRFQTLPIIALSTLAGEDQMAEGFAAGVSDYLIKLDQGQLLDSLHKALAAPGPLPSPAMA